MLAKWTELLPLFVIKWLARRYCEQIQLNYGSDVDREFHIARPDVLVKKVSK